MNMYARKKKKAFTLIELLVVVAIILILFSISMKLMAIANRKAAVSKTTWLIEQVKNSLGAFYSEYGSYPPASSLEYTWVDPGVVAKYPTVSSWPVSTGLVYFLEYFEDPPGRKIGDKWNHYFDQVLEARGDNPSNRVEFMAGQYTPYFTNHTMSIQNDAWGHALHYSVSKTAGYQGYKLWSDGPNGVNENGANDDIGVLTGDQ